MMVFFPFQPAHSFFLHKNAGKQQIKGKKCGELSCWRLLTDCTPNSRAGAHVSLPGQPQQHDILCLQYKRSY